MQVAQHTEDQAIKQNTADDTGGRKAPVRDNPVPRSVSRNTSQTQEFQERLQVSFSHHSEKSVQFYNLFCKKWIGWCTEQSLDLVSEFIKDVVDFLTHLHTGRYKYCSYI